LTYEQELPLKSAALEEFWRAASPDGPPLSALIPSPQGRAYRTVTKRKVFLDGRRRFLGLVDPDAQRTAGGLEVQTCLIEPASHGAVFSAVAAHINRAQNRTIASCLRYVIVRGTGAAQAVILSVDGITPAVVREANGLSRSITRAAHSVTGVFLFEDPSDGRYYLGSGVAAAARQFRKLFGERELATTTAGVRFAVHPLAFSQVNAGGAEILVSEARRLLRPAREDRLLDLYCGTGLFALCLAPHVRQVTGVESSPHGVTAAIANARGQRHVRFHRDTVTPESISRHGGVPGPRDLVILDPPRGGTEEGIIETVAGRSPMRVLHIFCNTGVIAAELERWRNCGYAVTAAVPVDMFPGTAAVEILVLLEKRDGAGVTVSDAATS
jgi:tRNA/tmRNA/rRNA uracil-C5-methylase (TrmA/RlmC/RlmD family)